MKQVIADLDIKDKIKFVGFLHGEELNRLTAEAMCVACPAIWYENLPNVVLEAFANGRPVIATNVGSLADAVEDGKDGFLFERKNSKQIADCIRKLYENPQVFKEMQINARKKCETIYSPQAHWDTFIKIYEKVLTQKSNR